MSKFEILLLKRYVARAEWELYSKAFKEFPEDPEVEKLRDKAFLKFDDLNKELINYRGMYNK